MTYRVLVVDDYEPWRRHIRPTLENHLRCRVVSEASDGLEAVEKATALRPDMILLDVGLPSLNGIEAARRILALDSSSRILFVSEHRSWEVARAALNTGARGYVVKSDAGRELPAAIEAVVGGKRFISARLRPLLERRTDPGRRAARHQVVFYSDEEWLLDDYSRIAQATVESGNTFVILAGSSRREHLHRALQARGIDVDHGLRTGRYCEVDPRDLLSNFMVDGWPDETKFWEAATSFIAGLGKTAIGERPRVVVCGECAPTLLNEGHVDAAIRVEHLWDEFARIHAVDTLCGYLLEGAGYDEQTILQRISAVHSAFPWG